MTKSKDIDQQDMADKAQTVTTRVQEKAGQTAEQVSQQARDTAKNLEQQAVSALDSRKSQAAQELGTVASAIYESSQALRDQGQDMGAQYTERVAAQIDHISSYLQAHNFDELVDEAENFARRQPQLFLGGAFIVGLLAARFLKSSRSSETNRYEQQWGGSQSGMTGYSGAGYSSYAGSAGYGGGTTGYGSGSTSGSTSNYGQTSGTTGTGSYTPSGTDWSSTTGTSSGTSTSDPLTGTSTSEE